MSRTARALQVCLALAMVIGITNYASAVLLVYEPFDYVPTTDILGQGGATNGFTGAWRENSAGSVPAGSFTAVAGSLNHNGVPTSGNSAILTGEFGTLQPARDYNEIAGGAGTTTWYSYIGQRQGAVQDPLQNPDNPYPRGVNAGLFDADHPTRTERVGVGNSSGAATDAWSIIPEGSGSLIEQSTDPFSNLRWAVLKIEHVGDATVGDNFYLFLDPDPNIEPVNGDADVTILDSVDASGLDYIRPFVGGEDTGNDRPFGVLVMDEIRIGTEYADMSGTRVIPEPASALLAVLAGLAVCGCRRVR